MTLSPDETGGNFRVVLADGTGETADAPQAERAAIAAEEILVHGLRGMQGQPWQPCRDNKETHSTIAGLRQCFAALDLSHYANLNEPTYL